MDGTISRTAFLAMAGLFCFFSCLAPDTSAETMLYVDDNAPNDPAHGDPDAGDAQENGSFAHPFDAIQEAIDTASDGDTIVVLNGTYTGDGNRDIDFNGKAVALVSQNGPQDCIIDCQGSEADPHRGFHFHNGEGNDSIVEGFTIRNGYILGDAPDLWGGGISCNGSSPTIRNNVITRNMATAGGGIACSFSSPTIINNTITANTAVERAGGLACYASQLDMKNSIVWRNIAADRSEIALWTHENDPCSLSVSFCDISGGQAGVYVQDGCILEWGEGNIDTDPLFAYPKEPAGIDTIFGAVTSAEIDDFVNGVYSPRVARLVDGLPPENIFFIDEENGDDTCVGDVPVNDGHSPDKALKTFDEAFHKRYYDERVQSVPLDEWVVVFVLGDRLKADSPIRRPNVRFVGVDYPLLYPEQINGVCQDCCTVTICRDNIEVCGFRIRHPCGNGLSVDGNNIFIHHNRFVEACNAGGDVALGGFTRTSNCVVEYNVFSGDPANFASIRIWSHAERSVIRHNEIHRCMTFVKFYGATNVFLHDNRFFDQRTDWVYAGFLALVFTEGTARCFSLNDALDGAPLGPGDYNIHEAALDCSVASSPEGHEDYHLRSRNGRWDSLANGGAGGWVSDGRSSSCIDGGDPASDSSNEPQPNYGTVNIGAYGNTHQASRSRWNLPGDITGDCAVNILDMAFVRNRLYRNAYSGDNWMADVTGDGLINVLDIMFVRNKFYERCK